ncbi:uncharacterized protein C1orf158 homolog [Belonocnema kinseyi]|uniref:uncharacterized protein C1orf158 homolog n=1 Tax=Belonocnema kinseyi TaxID=2817044 RepID=UPI00143E0127|nr:uncharacterized protein C1orf158 homolog [Belonocnema kinseyi]
MTCMNFAFGNSDEIPLLTFKKSVKDSQTERFESEQKQKYGAGVLVGNWFDRRAEYTPSFNEWQTTYKSLYQSYDPKFLNNDRTALWDRKIEDEGLGYRFIIGHHDQYLKNMTTSSDIFHRIIPQKVPCSRTFKVKRNEWLPQQDLLQCFGNATEYGLVKKKEYKMMEFENQFRPWDTVYNCSYKKPQGFANLLEKRYVKPQSDFNKVNLDHLGIDLNNRCKITFKKTECN